MATYYWVSRGTGFSTAWTDSGNWASSSGGAGGAGVPTSADDAVVDANSFAITTLPTVNVSSASVCRDFTISGVTVAMTFTLSSNLTVSGSLSIQTTNVTRAGNGTFIFDGSGTHTVDFGGLTFSSITFQGTGTYTLQSAFTSQSGNYFLTHSNGTLDFNGYTVTTPIFQSNGTNTRTFIASGSTINITGNNAAVINCTATGFSYSGTRPVFTLNYSGGTGTRTINTGAATSSQAMDFNITAGTDTVAFGGGDGFNNIDFTGFSGTLSNGSRTIYGNFKVSTGMTLSAGTGATTFAGTSGTQQITSNAKTFDFPITQNGAGGTVQLQDNLTMGSTRTYTLTAGTLDISSGNRTLSCGAFSSSNSNTRSILFGTGNITVTSNNATVWTTATATGFSYTGTPTVNCTYSGSVGTRTIGTGTTATITESNALSFNISAGTDIVTISTNHALRSLNFTGFAGSLSSANRTLYGSLTLGSGMTVTDGTGVTTFASTTVQQNITSNGVTFGGPMTINGTQTVQLQDNLTLSSTRSFTLTAGTLDLSNGNRTLSCGAFGSSNSNTRSIAFGTGQINLTNNSATIWNQDTSTNLSFTGTPTVNATYSGSTGTRAFTTASVGAIEGTNLINLNITSGSDIVQINSNRSLRSLNFTGFSGTSSNFSTTNINIYGDLVFSSAMTLTAGSTGGIAFRATSGTQQVTTNGKTIDYALIVNGSGGTVAFQDALTQGSTRTFTLTTGTLQFKNGVTSNIGTIALNSTSTKSIASTSAGSAATVITANSTTANAINLSVRDCWISPATNAYTGSGNALSYGCTNLGNNRGWNFTPAGAGFLVFF